MRPYDIYTQTRLKGKKGRKKAKNFFDSKTHTNGIQYRYSLLNDYNAPTVHEIYEEQKKQFKIKAKIAKMNFSESISKINEDVNIAEDWGYDIDEETLNSIEKIFGAWNVKNSEILSFQDISSKIKKENIMLKDFEKTVNEMTSLFLKLSKLNDEQLLTEIDRINKRVEEIKKASNEIGDGFLANPIYINESTKKKSTMIGSLLGYGKRLKGRYFELLILDFINRNIIPNTKNVKILDTAYLLDSSGKMSSSDIMMFDRKAMIEVNGEKISFGEWIDRIEKLNGKKECITIVRNNFNNIQSALLSGIQIKSGRNQNIFNTKKLSVEDVSYYSKDSIYGILLRNLTKLLQEEPNASTSFYHYNNIYDSLFNYNLSHCIDLILGEFNSIVATRVGLEFIDDYFDTRKYYLGADKVNIYLSEKQNIIKTKKI